MRSIVVTLTLAAAAAEAQKRMSTVQSRGSLDLHQCQQRYPESANRGAEGGHVVGMSRANAPIRPTNLVRGL